MKNMCNVYVIRTFLSLLLFLSWTFILQAYSKFPQTNVISQKENFNLEKHYWIIYDNVCPYCREASKHIKTLDWEGKFKFISYRNNKTYEMFPFLSKGECAKDVHMVTPKGEVLVGYKVFRTVIDNLTATKILNPLLKNDYAEKKLNEIYQKMVEKRTCYYNKSGTCSLKAKDGGKKEQ